MTYLRKISDTLTITNMRMEHADGVSLTVRLAFKVGYDEECDDCIGPRAIRMQLQRFPEGQFVALLEDEDAIRVVGSAHTMRTSKAPHGGTWKSVVGNLGIVNHEPNGEWLYGVEMAVRPSYHGFGIGSALYEARFELCRQLNLKGWYAGGMLMGYANYQEDISPLEYGQRVLNGEIIDPTVNMQVNRGFKMVEVIEDYMDEPPSGNAAMHILWENPDYQEDK